HGARAARAIGRAERNARPAERGGRSGGKSSPSGVGGPCLIVLLVVSRAKSTQPAECPRRIGEPTTRRRSPHGACGESSPVVYFGKFRRLQSRTWGRCTSWPRPSATWKTSPCAPCACS